LIFVSILLLFAGPFGVKYFLDQSVRKVEVVKDEVVKLNYLPELIIKGHLINIGKVDYHGCTIEAKILKSDPNRYKNILYSLKPLYKKSIYLDKNVSIKERVDFKMVIENFVYKKDFNVTLSGVCY